MSRSVKFIAGHKNRANYYFQIPMKVAI